MIPGSQRAWAYRAIRAHAHEVSTSGCFMSKRSAAHSGLRQISAQPTATSCATRLPMTTSATAISDPAGGTSARGRGIWLFFWCCSLKPQCRPEGSPGTFRAPTMRALATWCATSRPTTPMSSQGDNGRRSRSEIARQPQFATSPGIPIETSKARQHHSISPSSWTP